MIDHVKWLEENYPKMTGEFKKIQQEQYELFCKKQRNYGPRCIALGTQLKYDDEIKDSLRGLWNRMYDKVERIRTLLRGWPGNEAEDEPLIDSYLDTSNYGIMAEVVRRRMWGE